MGQPVRLLMAQVDDASGEMLGEFLRRAEALGVRNVQIVASITKKGRPGHIVYVDVAADLEPQVALLLGRELGAWGYRVLASEHHHFDIERVNIPLTVHLAGSSHSFQVSVKLVSHAGKRLRIKAEHDDLSSICSALRAKGCEVPLTALKTAVESQWSEDYAHGVPMTVHL